MVSKIRFTLRDSTNSRKLPQFWNPLKSYTHRRLLPPSLNSKCLVRLSDPGEITWQVVTSRDWQRDVTWLVAWRHVTPEQDILYHIITSPSIWWGGVTLTLTLLYTACVWCRVLHYTWYYISLHCTTLFSVLVYGILHNTVFWNAYHFITLHCEWSFIVRHNCSDLVSRFSNTRPVNYDFTSRLPKK